LDHADPTLALDLGGALAAAPSPVPDPARGGVARFGGRSAWFGAPAAA
jgi:hypothetical protein